MYYLDNNRISFPHPKYADKDGLLAVGGDMSFDRLMFAYEIGTFPWYNPDELPLWWHPDPRFVIFPEKVKVSKSMRSYFNQEKYHVTIDKCFVDVMLGCKTVERKGNPGTWITSDFLEAYITMHENGFAHSVEVWDQEENLVGGLYGVNLGKVFYGESMFSRLPNSSKFALITIAKLLEKNDFHLIDCQMPNPHLKSMGGEFIPRQQFLEILDWNKQNITDADLWATMTEGINYGELIKK